MPQTNRVSRLGRANAWKTALDLDADPIKDRRLAVSAAIRNLGPVVYAVRTTDGLIKFGHSTDLLKRIYAYGISLRRPDRLLLAMPGTPDDEATVHHRFFAHLVRGDEYYSPVPEIIDYINTERARMGVPDITWPEAT